MNLQSITFLSMDFKQSKSYSKFRNRIKSMNRKVSSFYFNPNTKLKVKQPIVFIFTTLFQFECSFHTVFLSTCIQFGGTSPPTSRLTLFCVLYFYLIASSPVIAYNKFTNLVCEKKWKQIPAIRLYIFFNLFFHLFLSSIF